MRYDVTVEQVWDMNRFENKDGSTTGAMLVQQALPSQNRIRDVKRLVRLTGRSPRGANAEPTLQ
jgi:hypothetical protein